jgi:hypothetical protein
MEYKLQIRAGGMESWQVLFDTKPEGVSISPQEWNVVRQGGMANDSAEYILQMIVSFSRDLEIALLATWLSGVFQKPDGKKTTIDGQQIPPDKTQITVVIKMLIEEQRKAPPDEE